MEQAILETLKKRPEQERYAYECAMQLIGACGAIIAGRDGTASTPEAMQLAIQLLDEAKVDVARIMHDDLIRTEGEE